MQTIQRRDWLILTALVAAWGSSFAMTKIAVGYLDATWVMAGRLTVAAAILAPNAITRGVSLRATPAIWTKFVWLALVGNVVPFALIGWGTRFVASGVSGLLMGAIPLMLVALAHFVLPEERLTLPKAVGFVLGFCGVIVLIGPEQLLHLEFAGPALKGELAILLACALYAIHAVSAKKLGVEPPLQQSAAVCLAASVIGLAVAWWMAPLPDVSVPLSAWAAVAGLGLIPTALATLMTYRLMDRAGPSFISYANYLVPVWALALGAALLGEPLGWNMLAALGLILGGIAVSRMKLAAQVAASSVDG